MAKRQSIKTAPGGTPLRYRAAVFSSTPTKGYVIVNRATGLEFWACVENTPQWHTEGKGWVFEHYHSAYFVKLDLTQSGHECYIIKINGYLNF